MYSASSSYEIRYPRSRYSSNRGQAINIKQDPRKNDILPDLYRTTNDTADIIVPNHRISAVEKLRRHRKTTRSVAYISISSCQPDIRFLLYTQ